MQRTALVVMPSGVSEERSGGCMRTRSALAGALRTSHASCRRRARFCTIEHGARRGITEITFVTSSPVPKGRLDDSRGRSESLFHPYGRASPRNAGQEALGSRHWPSVTGSSRRRPTTPGTRHKCRGDQTRRALRVRRLREHNDPEHNRRKFTTPQAGPWVLVLSEEHPAPRRCGARSGSSPALAVSGWTKCCPPDRRFSRLK